ncbi:MAG: 3-oxoacyl-ACP synthase, partial [Bacteroidales bacterium]|nr:3-oxoacyl-ACP synthase [Bacteroidales bacterium]
MENRTVRVISDNIVSPLGLSSGANWQSVYRGRTCLALHEGLWGLPEPFCASLFDRDSIDGECVRAGLPEGLTFFEKTALLSASAAVRESGIDPSSESVIFIISTTKGNVSLLCEPGEYAPGRETLHA